MINYSQGNIKSKLRKYSLSVKQLAEIFGYSNEMSFRNSSAYQRHISAVYSLINIIEQQIASNITN